ncbi:hypothetical protein P3X46_012259 [Hevea brasiliensis]|uniref:FACT complex subunit n=1 Tax=Hevea brasiliensis TaxID=3981 RepID=A0ABQ9MAR9_HEVBR|nr:hypothetical protein P3X46_012259 [Hevea brasiliensis]
MLENQITQQASSSSKATCKLPSQPEMNPREHCKVEPIEETIEKSKDQAEKKEEEMPSYAKFLKEILSKKRKLEDYGIIALTEECSAIQQNKLPPKLKDPGSFSIPCLIGNKKIDKALCDLEASIGELKPTTISLQLADRFIKYPMGILENIPIKVGKFFIPVDFVVLEMEEDVGEEKVEFNLFDTMKHKFEPDECFKVHIIDEQVKKDFMRHILKILLKHLKEKQTKGKLQENTKQVELKPLPSSLRYAFMDSNSNYPIIINASLSKLEEKKLLRELRIHSKAIGYKIEDLKGINPSICMHRISMEENSKPTIEHQRRLNPNMKKIMGIWDSFKFLFTHKTKKRQHSFVPIEHLHIGECLLVFVMPLLPFKDA